MKTLFINRHAKSSWSNAGQADFDRPLNKRGKINAEFLAEKFKNEEHTDIIISSPAKRAISTAHYFASTLGIDKSAIVQEKRIYGASVPDMIEILNNIDDAHATAMIFGHNPTFSSLANYLAPEFEFDLVTCARVKIQFEIDNWRELSGGIGTLVQHIIPRSYKEMENL